MWTYLPCVFNVPHSYSKYSTIVYFVSMTRVLFDRGQTNINRHVITCTSTSPQFLAAINRPTQFGSCSDQLYSIHGKTSTPISCPSFFPGWSNRPCPLFSGVLQKQTLCSVLCSSHGAGSEQPKLQTPLNPNQPNPSGILQLKYLKSIKIFSNQKQSTELQIINQTLVENRPNPFLQSTEKVIRQMQKTYLQVGHLPLDERQAEGKNR